MRSICVFIGSSQGSSPLYRESTIMLAKQIAQRNVRLVYGGARVGLMGVLADTVLKLGGEVVGIIPKRLMEKEMAHQGLTKLQVVDSIQERKLVMAHLSDGFIALPGGLGTLEEIFEVWNAIKMGLYQKPFGVLNVNKYFDPLLSFLKSLIKEGFIKQKHIDLLMCSNDPNALLDKMGMSLHHDFLDEKVKNIN